jgi:hypothetical protein
MFGIDVGKAFNDAKNAVGKAVGEVVTSITGGKAQAQTNPPPAPSAPAAAKSTPKLESENLVADLLEGNFSSPKPPLTSTNSPLGGEIYDVRNALTPENRRKYDNQLAKANAPIEKFLLPLMHFANEFAATPIHRNVIHPFVSHAVTPGSQTAEEAREWKPEANFLENTFKSVFSLGGTLIHVPSRYILPFVATAQDHAAVSLHLESYQDVFGDTPQVEAAMSSIAQEVAFELGAAVAKKAYPPTAVADAGLQVTKDFKRWQRVRHARMGGIGPREAEKIFKEGQDQLTREVKAYEAFLKSQRDFAILANTTLPTTEEWKKSYKREIKEVRKEMGDALREARRREGIPDAGSYSQPALRTAVKLLNDFARPERPASSNSDPIIPSNKIPEPPPSTTLPSRLDPEPSPTTAATPETPNLNASPKPTPTPTTAPTPSSSPVPSQPQTEGATKEAETEKRPPERNPNLDLSPLPEPEAVPNPNSSEISSPPPQVQQTPGVIPTSPAPQPYDDLLQRQFN